MYQWTQKEPLAALQTPPGKLESSMVWPHANEKRTSPKNREGESKIPKLMASTPKARIQLVSSLISMHDQPSLTLLNGTETDHNKVNELKMKMSKCESIQEMFLLIKSFLSEYSMHSSESSTNSGIFTNSALNGTESTVFDRSMETTVFNVLNQRQRDTSNPTKSLSPIKTRAVVKSRTSPNTPTGSTTRADPKRFRRNLSVDSVNATSPPKLSENLTGSGCRRCAHLLTSPKKTTDKKRMVDKATVMEVDPIVLSKALELVSIETQTEPPESEDKAEPKKAEISVTVPPPPPPMMPPPPPPPPLPIPNAPSMPGQLLRFSI